MFVLWLAIGCGAGAKDVSEADASTDTNTVDDDCADGPSAWHPDADGDGWGDPAGEEWSCGQPPDHVADASDCDDARAEVSPDAVETCGNGLDDDCEGGDEACEEEDDLVGADARLLGVAEGDWTGSTLAPAGDVDGDGYGDVLVGAYAHQGTGWYSGVAYLVLGPVSGDVNLADADATMHGGAALEGAGSSITRVGQDRDGLSGWLLVGVPGADEGGDGAGGVALVPDATRGSVDLLVDAVRLYGEDEADGAGGSADTAGDMNGDGRLDAIVGAVNAYSGFGAAYIVAMPAVADGSLSDGLCTLVGEKEGDQAGISVAGAGDTDGDGFDDVIVGAIHAGAEEYAGAAYVVFGPVSGIRSLSTADVTLRGENAYDGAGVSVDGAGDMDGDGRADLLVGAPYIELGGDLPGQAYLVLGGVTGELQLADADAIFVGEETGDSAGSNVAGVGDVDQDGWSDVLIGAPDHSHNGGAAYLVRGPRSGTLDLASADRRFVGEQDGDQAGLDVSAAGDVDGNGFPDLLIGAYGNDALAPDAGAAYLLYQGVE